MHPMMGRGPRIGFEFSDGTRARLERPAFGPPPMPTGGSSVQNIAVLTSTSTTTPPGNPFGVPVDADGMPLEPYLTPKGGGGGGDRFSMTYWCYPLPPAGPMTIHADWPDQAFEEVAIPFDADPHPRGGA